MLSGLWNLEYQQRYETKKNDSVAALVGEEEVSHPGGR